MTPADPLVDAERRWQRLVDARPELAAAVELQRVLVTRSLELAADAPALTRGASAAPPDLSDRIARRTAPVLDLAVELDVARLLPHLLGFCDDFAAGGAGDRARHVRAVIERGEIDPGSLLRASLARQAEAIRTGATRLGVAPDLVWLVAELAVGPLAHHLQQAVLGSPAAAAAVRAAVDAWPHGHCPACGSWPALAETRAGARHLRCSFCGADWTPPDARCVYCDRTGDDLLTAGDADRPGRRLECCRACGAYLKQVEAAAAIPFALLPVLDLETSDLDLHAAGRGYGRPPMRVAGPLTACPPESVS